MIHWKFLKPLALAITVNLAVSIASSPSANAEDAGSGISLGSVKFGKAPNKRWLFIESDKVPNSPTGARRSTGALTSLFSTRSLLNDPKMLQAARIAVSQARRHSTRKCWRYVKTALLKADVVDSYPRTAYAKQAGNELERDFGFVKTGIRTPEAAPIGSVLVYGGRGAGHVEIRAAEGYVSDFVSPKPSPRPLIGVYVKR
ncbi:MAG TPA: hypothetical protein VIT21_04720 [Chthoniobacterales bacterium]